MRINNIVKSVRLFVLAGLCAGMAGCSDFIYDDEGDCTVRYLVKFKYDYNMKFADAFRPEVDMVTLNLVDDSGKVVWTRTESGEALKAEGYAMQVDVAPGTYSLLAWCSSAEPTTFTTGDDGTREGLHTHFHAEADESGACHIRHSLDRLYHSYMPDVEFPDISEGDVVYTMPLTKDTNHFVITLQQLSGEPIDENMVEFEITDDNRHLQWHNLPLPGNRVTYHQWYRTTVDADISTATASRDADNGRFAGVIAELTTSRLMEDSNARLNVYRTDTGETIASIRLIDAVLLVMGYENSRLLSAQQYLDYKDEYNMTFFLDKDHHWVDGALQIESWRVVYKDVEID